MTKKKKSLSFLEHRNRMTAPVRPERARRMRNGGPVRLPDDKRKKMIAVLVEDGLSAYFGDGLETDYLLNGISWKGLNNVTDDELIAEYDAVFGDEEVD